MDERRTARRRLSGVALAALVSVACWLVPVAAMGFAQEGARRPPQEAAPPAVAPPASAPALHPAQRSPTDPGFPTGPAVGERLPDFRLPNQRGETVDFHADRGGRRAAVLFQRSAVW